jgi:hypothetical protein
MTLFVKWIKKLFIKRNTKVNLEYIQLEFNKIPSSVGCFK